MFSYKNNQYYQQSDRLNLKTVARGDCDSTTIEERLATRIENYEDKYGYTDSQSAN